MMLATKLLLVMGVVAAKQDDGGNNYEELGEILKNMVLSYRHSIGGFPSLQK